MLSLVPSKRSDGRIRFYAPQGSLVRELDRMVDSLWSGWGLAPLHEQLFERSLTGFSPRLDITEDDKAYLVKAELPGVTDKDINLEVKDGVLTIKGEKKEEKEEQQDDCCTYRERTYGSFARQVCFDQPIDATQIGATFKDGVLSVTVPKVPEKPGTKIEVKAA